MDFDNLRENLGQLIAAGFTGTEPSREIEALIRHHRVGSVILFSRNISNIFQLRKLTAQLQAIARDAGHSHPLLISIDQENGIVRRLRSGGTLFPGNMALGAAGDPELAYKVALATGKELRALGVNMNLAPVADVNHNPENPVIGVRSFGEDPENVASLVKAAVKGYQEAGVISNLKHFPGHGDTSVDSHLALPAIDHPIERIRKVELVPFKEGIKAGADSVMVAHIYFKQLMGISELPATVSEEIITKLLRKECGFNGVVTSDCMEMDAVAKTIGIGNAAVKAVKAGLDLVFVSHRADRQIEALQAIREAVETGEISEKTVAQALQRVSSLKEQYLTREDTSAVKERIPDWVGGRDHARLAGEAYQKSITAIKDKRDALPVALADSDKLLFICPESKTFSLVEDNRFHHHFAKNILSHYHENIETFEMTSKPAQPEIETIVHKAKKADYVFAASSNASHFPEQADLINQLDLFVDNLIVISVRNPYDVMAFPGVSTVVATYEYSPPAIKAAFDAIFGKAAATGKLPVTIPGV